MPKEFNLYRVVNADPQPVEYAGYEFSAGETVADVIKQMAGIGYGGHFAETSDDEVSVYQEVALSHAEFNWILEQREKYCRRLEDILNDVQVETSPFADARSGVLHTSVGADEEETE